MPLPEKTIKVLEKFAQRFEIQENGCWLWYGALRSKTHQRGAFYHNYKTHSAYKFLYEIVNGKVKGGLVLDHLCGETRCVNPKHLEPVTTLKNTQRYYAQMTHCKRGHKFGEQPAWIKRSKYSNRRCITCHNMRHRKIWRLANVPPSS